MLSPVENVVCVAGTVWDGADHSTCQLHRAGLAGADLILRDQVPIPALNVKLKKEESTSDICFCILSHCIPVFQNLL